MNEYRYQAVEQRIMDMIDNGTLGLGDRLPSLRKLGRDMGVSISTATQAYTELERKGVVEARPRSGYFVRHTKRRFPAPQAEPRPAQPPRPVTRAGLIRTVLEYVGREDAIGLGIIEPHPSLLPSRELGRLLARHSRDHATTALSYEVIQGNPELRRQIAHRSLEAGISARHEDILVTNGAMEALYIALRCITRPGDNVLVQSPAYFCFLQLLENMGLRAIEVESTPDRGLNPALVADAVAKYDVKACIFVPNFANPDGSLTPDEAKREIVRLLEYMDIPLIEDDVSSDIHFDPKRPGTYKQYDEKGLVMLCSSFSKTVAPGWRIGWMLPGRYLNKAREIKATTNVCSATPTQAAMASFLAEGRMEKQLRTIRTAIERTMDVMQLELNRSFPEGTRVTHPKGGSVLWVTLPGGVDSVDFFFEAREHGVGIAPGGIFTTRERFTECIRLSCCGVWSDELSKGIATLGDLARRMAR